MYQRSRRRVATDSKIPPQPPPMRPRQSSIVPSMPNESANWDSDRDTPEEQAMPMEGVYIISVAARILDVHPQTLRKYERLELINPGRTLGRLRLYSREDIRKVRLIQHLAGNLGLNLAGVEFALSMVDNLVRFKQRLESAVEGNQLQNEIERELALLFRSMDLPLED